MTGRSFVALLSIGGITAIFFWQYLSVTSHLETLSTLEEQLTAWGQFFIVLLGLGIALGIVLTIIAEVVSRIVHKTTIFEDDDERDKLIDGKSARNAAYAFAISFFGAMALAAFFEPAMLMFHVLAYGFLATGLTLNISYIFFYQRGY